jgi:hypothetical protein
MHKSKFSLKGWVAASAVIGAAFVFGGAAQAAQTVDFAEAGSTTAITSKSVTPGGAFSFDVVYKGGANESGLGLKLRYNPAQFAAINVVSGQTFMSCNIGGAVGTVGDSTDGIQKQTGSFSGFGGQFVAGWIYTANDAGAVKWPNGPAPAAANDCLVNSGSATNSGSDVRLFRVNATTVAGFTGSTTMELTADGNFSYAQASPGVTNKTLTLTQGTAAGPNIVSAVSRKAQGAGSFDLPLAANSIGPSAASAAAAGGAISIDPRGSGTHTMRVTFDAAVTSASVTASGLTWNGTAGVSSSVTVGTVVFSGNTIEIPLSGVQNDTRVLVNIGSINGGAASTQVALGVSRGDVNASSAVNVQDVNAVKSQSLQPISSTNFTRDVNADGVINVQDVNAVKARSLIGRLP